MVRLDISLYEGETPEGLAGWLRGRFGAEVTLDDESDTAWPVFVVNGDAASVAAVEQWYNSSDPEWPGLTAR
jgi:hypothetical protein